MERSNQKYVRGVAVGAKLWPEQRDESVTLEHPTCNEAGNSPFLAGYNLF
jgi:hypothetical protein